MTDMITLTDLLDDNHMTEDLEDFLWACQQVLDDLINDVSNFTNIINPDKCEEQYLDLMMEEMGFNLWQDIDLAVNQKRKLVKSLKYLYSKKGTEEGIKNSIWFLLGIDVTLRRPFEDYAFTLGVSELEVSSELVPETKPHSYHYTIEVHLAESVDSETETYITKILELMTEKHVHFNIYQPGDENVIDSWVLGVSRLGYNYETVLSS